MGKINQIEPFIYNRISAGEVIERPLSVVKECIENSIDGGATTISIYVSNDAKNIRIVDDGVGMSRDDAKLAFMPHCTSKLKNVEDLDCIQTLGFRGEALASIASIAMVSMDTCDEETGETTRIELRDGKIINVADSSIDYGTDINIENIFYNTPVRAKFLKSTKSEEGEITGVISKFILANPHITFNYYLNGTSKFKFNGEGLEKAVYTVYGKDAVSKSMYIQQSRNGILVSGYIGKIDFTKPNRTYQTVILNGRSVVNDTMGMAVYKAYQPYLMKRCYPFYVLHIDIPAETVDVNAHPTKNDVRFSDEREVFRNIYSIISSALSGDAACFPKTKPVSDFIEPETAQIPLVFNDKFEPMEKEKEEILSKLDVSSISTFDSTRIDSVNTFNGDTLLPQKEQGQDIFDKNTYAMPITLFQEKSKYKDQSIVNADGTYTMPIMKKAPEGQPNGFYLNDAEECNLYIPKYDDARVIGVFNKTYIIAEADNKLFMLDQHACHERVLYDEYTLSYHKQKILIQDLLVPYVLEVNSVEDEFIRKHISNLFVLGFKMETFGQNTYRVTSVPANLVNINFDNFFRDLFSDVNRMLEITAVELVRDKLMQLSCKNAVKAGYVLNDYEIKCIFKMLERSNAVTCPHGRPLAVILTKTEIEKMFKRIV